MALGALPDGNFDLPRKEPFLHVLGIRPTRLAAGQYDLTNLEHAIAQAKLSHVHDSSTCERAETDDPQFAVRAHLNAILRGALLATIVKERCCRLSPGQCSPGAR